MAGLLGAMVAGAAGGYAKQRIDTINKEEDFNFKQALQASEAEYNMQLKRAGIQLDNENEEAKFNKRVAAVKEVNASVVDPMEGKGGYEAPEDEAKRTRSTLEKRAEALINAGYTTEADAIYKRIDASNKNENQLATIAAREKQIENTYEAKRLQLEMQGKLNESKIETVNAKRGSGRAPTADETKRSLFMNAYGNNPKYVKNGKFTEEGYNKFYKLDDNQAFDKVREEDLYDDNNRPVLNKDGSQAKKKTVERQVPQQQASGVLNKDKNGNYTFSR